MKRDNYNEKLIKDSLKQNLNKVKLNYQVKEDIISEIRLREKGRENYGKLKYYYQKVLTLLDYQVEIPLSYLLLTVSVLIVFYTYQISGLIPDTADLNSYNFNWIINNYKGMS